MKELAAKCMTQGRTILGSAMKACASGTFTAPRVSSNAVQFAAIEKVATGGAPSDIGPALESIAALEMWFIAGNYLTK
jgi:hypothetical protein